MTLRKTFVSSVLWAVFLFFGTLLSRVFFQSQILYHWDSVNFAYAIKEFNVLKDQPQPPGYIIYVYLIRYLNFIFQDAQTSMVVVSMIVSAISVVALFLFVRKLFDQETGIIASLFWASSPLFWFYGEIALPHTLDALLVIMTVWFFYELMTGDDRYLFPGIVTLAIAGGVRQQTLVFLLPLALFSMRKLAIRKIIFAGLIGGIICIMWFIPLIKSAGGLRPYLDYLGEFSARFQTTTSIFAGAGWLGIKRNLLKLSIYSIYGWGAAIFLMFIPIFRIKKFAHFDWKKSIEKILFLVLWVAPTLFFYVFIHMGQQGLVFVFLPLLLICSSLAVSLIRGREKYFIVSGIVAVNALIFCVLPEYPFGEGSQRVLTWDTIKNSDRYFQSRFDLIQSNFPPSSTFIVAESWHHVEYYLPDYSILPFNLVGKWEVNQGNPVGNQAQEIHLTDQKEYSIVFFDPVLLSFYKGSDKLQTLSNENTMLHFLKLRDRLFVINSEGFMVK